MRRTKGVVLRLAALGKSRNAAGLTQVRHGFAPAGKNLVRIRLVPDVPDESVVGRIEYVMQRNREFDRSEIGGKVPACAGH